MKRIALVFAVVLVFATTAGAASADKGKGAGPMKIYTVTKQYSNKPGGHIVIDLHVSWLGNKPSGDIVLNTAMMRGPNYKLAWDYKITLPKGVSIKRSYACQKPTNRECAKLISGLQPHGKEVIRFSVTLDSTAQLSFGFLVGAGMNAQTAQWNNWDNFQ
jgi:hypothetical protein